MKKTLRHIMLGLSLTLLLTGCAREEFAPGTFWQEDEPGREMSLSFSVGLHSAQGSPQTRMTASVTQQANDAPFRGIERLYMIPFKAQDAQVRSGDKRWSSNLSLPQMGIPAQLFGSSANHGQFEGLVSNSNSHLYSQVYIHLQTNAVLAYGKALDDYSQPVSDDSIAFKHRNGVLLHPDLDRVSTTDEIGFDLEPIVSDRNKAAYVKWKNDVLQFLTVITNVTRSRNSVTYYFNNPATYHNHPGLTEALRKFTNEGRMFSLSADVLGKKLTQLFQDVYPYSQDKHNSADYHDGTYYYVYELSRQILSKIQNTNFIRTSGSGMSTKIFMLDNAPSRFGLPDGTVPALWREGSKAFATLENWSGGGSGMLVAPEMNICYPPSLWYFVNSPLLSTEDAEVLLSYTAEKVVNESASITTPVYWDDIAAQYESTSIQGGAVAAAVQQPLQYGVSLMALTLKRVVTKSLKDARDNSVFVNNTKFPLTGVILADQKPVRFDFTPSESAESHYVYDSDVYNGDTPLAYLSYNSNVSSVVPVLTLQTPAWAPLHFALEFRNNSTGSIFTADGCEVYPGCCFYLLGVIRMDGTESLSSIFKQDHVTYVNANITSLANSYSVLPSLDEPQLLLGVQAEMSWDFSTPAVVPVQ